MSHTLDQMKAATRRFVLEPWGQGNLAALDDVCSPNYTLGEMDLQGLKDAITEFRRIMPDLSIEIGEMIAEGDRVAYSWVMQGTHQGAYQGIAPTGKPLTATGITIVRFEDGRIVDDQFQSSSPRIEDQLA